MTHDRTVHFYHDWIVRTCSVQYDLSDLSNRTAHISNHCIQMESESYGTHEEGNEIFAADMKAYLERTYPEPAAEAEVEAGAGAGPGPGAGAGAGAGAENANGSKQSKGLALYNGIVDQMRSIAAHTVASIFDCCGGDEAFDSFQVLGYDFMPDEDGKVWLLEVNGSAAAAGRMTPGLAADVVQLAIDRIFPRGGPRDVGAGEGRGAGEGADAGAGPGPSAGAGPEAGPGPGQGPGPGLHPRWTEIPLLLPSAAGKGAVAV